MLFQKEILFLLDRDNDFFAKHYKKEGVDVQRIYKNVPLALKFIRRLHLKFNIPLYYLWFNKDWMNNLEEYQTVLLHTSIIKVPVIEYINKKHPLKRIIFWYWNPVRKSLPVENIRHLKCELWSFDQDDCERYGLKENTQFYFSNIDYANNSFLEYDILFVGKDKGRLNSLLELKKNFIDQGLNCEFHIVSDSKVYNSKKNYEYSEAIPYESILELISRSVAVLDFVSEGQYGLTLRPLEAMFLKRKLITNNSEIRNMDFYNPSNIFILGINRIEDLSEFLNTPFVEIDDDIVMKYAFSNWLKRFYE